MKTHLEKNGLKNIWDDFIQDDIGNVIVEKNYNRSLISGMNIIKSYFRNSNEISVEEFNEYLSNYLTKSMSPDGEYYNCADAFVSDLMKEKALPAVVREKKYVIRIPGT